MILVLGVAEGDRVRSGGLLNRRSREAKRFKSRSFAEMGRSRTRAGTLGISPGQGLAALLLLTPGADAFNVQNSLSPTLHQAPRPGLAPVVNQMSLMSEKGPRTRAADTGAPKTALNQGAIAAAASAALFLGTGAAIAADTQASNLPTTATGAAVSTLLASEGLLASITRDAVDVYYLVILIAVVVYYGYKYLTNVVEEAKDYDRRGSLANAAAAELKKRERAAKREAVKRNDVAYERLQAEAEQRANKRANWKQFPGFKQIFEDEE